MAEKSCFYKLEEIVKGKSFTKLLIERCERMLEQMLVVPIIRPAFDDTGDIPKQGICFDYDDDYVNIEIFISDDRVTGLLSDGSFDYSYFTFDTESDAINFWNFITKLSYIGDEKICR